MAGTTEVIDELIAAGVPVYGLSNWWAENFTVPRAVAPVIDRLRDVIVSGEVGLAKPDPAIFRLAATRFGVTPERTLFVDDSRPTWTRRPASVSPRITSRRRRGCARTSSGGGC
jgi:2-haloacid dehalogenase